MRDYAYSCLCGKWPCSVHAIKVSWCFGKTINPHIV